MLGGLCQSRKYNNVLRNLELPPQLQLWLNIGAILLKERGPVNTACLQPNQNFVHMCLLVLL